MKHLDMMDRFEVDLNSDGMIIDFLEDTDKNDA